MIAVSTNVISSAAIAPPTPGPPPGLKPPDFGASFAPVPGFSAGAAFTPVAGVFAPVAGVFRPAPDGGPASRCGAGVVVTFGVEVDPGFNAGVTTFAVVVCEPFGIVAAA